MEKRKRASIASESPPPSPAPPRPLRYRLAPCAAATPPPPPLPCLDACGSAAAAHEPSFDPPGPPRSPTPSALPIPRLPLDLTLQILSWLPARAVIRCRSICRAWDAAVRGDAAFASAHFVRSFAAESRSNEDVPSSFLVQTPTGGLYAAHLLPNGTTTTTSSTGMATLSPPSSTFGSGESWDVLDSCDGLLLLRGLYGGLILYNPMTRDHRSLPPPPASPSHVSAFALVFDPSRNGHKMVMLRNHRVAGDFKVQLLAYVCSTIAGGGRGRHDPPQWRSIGCIREGETMLNIFPDGVRVNGRLHWLTAVVGCPGIFSFDPLDVCLREVPSRKLAALPGPCEWRLTKLKGCITMLRVHGRVSCEGWVMANYGDDESWSVGFSFTMAEKPMCDIQKSRVVLPIDGGRVVLVVTRGHVVAIDTETQQWKHVFVIPAPDRNNRASSPGCLRLKFLPFVGSLVVPQIC